MSSEPDPGDSGSIDVSMSGPVPAAEDAPAASGRVVAAAATETVSGRASRRLTDAAKDALGGGVSVLGASIGTIGEGVSRLGEASRKVPIVGAGVARLGEGLTTVGESLTELPRVARTRRGALLVRSMFVGFALVFAWIAVIVTLQLRGTDLPDFRPLAAHVLAEISQGGAALEAVYDQASPRFHERESKERFVDDMTDLHATVGKFVEIAAVNDTIVTSGPTGRVGRVSLTVVYEKGTTRASVSLHDDGDAWKLLGIGVELPASLPVTQADREERVQACRDPMDPSDCDVHVAANRILEQLRDGRADAVWDEATRVFQQQEEKSKFMQIQRDHHGVLGDYRRIVAVSEARTIRGVSATFDVVLEYERSQGVRAIFGLTRGARTEAWKLRSLKIVLPMPRAAEPAPPKKPR